MTETLRTTEPLIRRVERIQDAMRSAGITPVDMRRAGTLETDVQLPELGGGDIPEPPTIERLEGVYDQIEQRPITRANTTKFTWFIDGSQKTMPIWRVGVVPIVVSIAVAGLLERLPDGSCRLVPGSLTESVGWIVPQQTNDPDIRKIVSILHEMDQDVFDPLDQQENYQQLAGMYDMVLFYANEAAGKMRERAEFRTISYWENQISATNPDRWLVIDGRLPVDATNAIGFIKDPRGQHLVGQEALTLLSLKPGNRTTAYRVTGRSRARTHWYQRMWPATGLDARHSLIRIEANGDLLDSAEIDEIATWLMAERLPRPTADGRWPTLLYPVHLLERMLKTRIAQITAGWPV